MRTDHPQIHSNDMLEIFKRTWLYFLWGKLAIGGVHFLWAKIIMTKLLLEITNFEALVKVQIYDVEVNWCYVEAFSFKLDN